MKRTALFLMLLSWIPTLPMFAQVLELHLTAYNTSDCGENIYFYQERPIPCEGQPAFTWGVSYPVQSYLNTMGLPHQTTNHLDYVTLPGAGECGLLWEAVDNEGQVVAGPTESTAQRFYVEIDNNATGTGCVVVEKEPHDRCGSDDGSGCSSCAGTGMPSGLAGAGMPTWSVSEPYLDLKLHDNPLGYQPEQGPSISFDLHFNQREINTGGDPTIFSIGKRWNFSWYSFATLSGDGETVHLPYGTEITFESGSTNDYLTNTRLSGNTNSGFTLTYPDGSQDVYGFLVTNSSGAFLEAFRTEQINPQSQKTLFYYANYTNNAPVVRLQYVVDGDGRTNSVYYATSNPYSTNLISYVVDAFNRTNFLNYDGSGHLTNIIDVQGISSLLQYGLDNVVSNLITPYGSTSFQTTTAPGLSSSVLVTQPDGGHQLFLYQESNSTPGFPITYPSSQIPSTATFPNTLDTNDLELRDSFHWGPLQYQNLSTNNIAYFTTNDFLLARMKHWLIGAYQTPGDTLSMQRDPSPDNAGMIEGQKTWYDYEGKPSNETEGTQIEPLFIAKVLPDGTTRFTYTPRNNLGAATNEISTYSVGSGGTVLLRTNSYVYAANGIDLLATTNALRVLVSSNIYNGNHQVATNYDALGEMTVYTYDTSNRLTGITSPAGLVTTNTYGSNGFLQQQVVVGFTTNSYTYASGLVFTHTDPRGLTTTNTWDSLQRLRQVNYPDGTLITNTYLNLDLVQVVDRLGFTNSYVFDSMRRMTNATDALARHTIYNYCSCGSLDSIEDATGNLTYFNRDNQGRVTNTVYPDTYSVTSQFNLVGQITNTVDTSGASVTNWFNNQGLRVAVSNAFGRVQSTAYDILDRATNTVDANAVSINTTYDYLNRPLTRTYPDDGTESFGYTANYPGMTSYTNQLTNVWTYAYDLANRKTNETAMGVYTNGFDYDGPGDLLSLTDGNGNTTGWNYDPYGRVTNKVDAAANVIFIYGYDADNRLTNRWTPVTSNTVYAYDPVGNLTNITYQQSHSISYSYDSLNRLVNMVDAVGRTAYTYDQVGQLLSEDGPWSDNTVNYTYNNRLRMGLTVQAPNASAWAQSYGYDSARRLTNIVSPAGAFTYQLGGAAPSSPLVKELLLPNGAYVTNYYDSNARLLGTALQNSSGGNIDAEAYAYNQGNQRTQQVFTAGNFMNYTYDNIGELQTALGKDPGGVTNRCQEQFGYTYDPAGNLRQRTNNALLEDFNVNNLNELTTVTNGGTLTVAGTTTSPATNVTVNGSNAVLYVDTTFASTNQPWVNGSNTFTAVGRDSYGRVSTNIVKVNLLGTNAFAYDLNGNMLTNNAQVLAYDDENQLIAVWVTNNWLSQFTYDGKMRRRIRKEYTWNGSSWIETNEVHYIYDGKLVIQERDGNNLPQVTYTRGTDLSGSLQGAGGIGGLLARTINPSIINSQLASSATAFYHADGNGNITCLIYTNQTIAAKYDYDPYGNVQSQIGSLADANLYRFSSKEFHPASGLIYYLYRYYDPNLQRWLNKDLIGERGGINLYSYLSGALMNAVDSFGLDTTLIDTVVESVGPAHQITQTGTAVGVKFATVDYTPAGYNACYEIDAKEDFVPTFTQSVQNESGYNEYQNDDSVEADTWESASQYFGGFPSDPGMPSDAAPPGFPEAFGENIVSPEAWASSAFGAFATIQRRLDTRIWREPFQWTVYSNGAFSWQPAGNSYYNGPARKISNCPCSEKVNRMSWSAIMSELNGVVAHFSTLTIGGNDVVNNTGIIIQQ